MNDIHDTALKYLLHRSRSEMSVRKHLSGKGYMSDEIDETIEYLKAFNYIDDRTYTEQYMRYAMSKGKGFARIMQELAADGITSAMSKEVYDEEFSETESEAERALNIARKTVAGASYIDERLMGKVARKLSVLGYGADTVYKVIDILKCEGKTDGMLDWVD